MGGDFMRTPSYRRSRRSDSGRRAPLLLRTGLAAVIFIERVASLPRLRALLHAPLSGRETDELTVAEADLFLCGCGGDRSTAAN
jgi:hypothetical protein